MRRSNYGRPAWTNFVLLFIALTCGFLSSYMVRGQMSRVEQRDADPATIATDGAQADMGIELTTGETESDAQE